MTELTRHEGIGDRPPVRKGVSPQAQVAVGVVMGGAVVLAAVWALVLASTLLTATTAQPEILWWAVFSGVVVACGLATPVALRLWKRGVEELRESGPDPNRALRGRGPTPAVVGRDEGRDERQLLEAIERHGEITPVRAALETSLTVAEADRMLSNLAQGGHLEVRVKEGKLLYGL